MKDINNKFTSRSDKKYICSFLYNIENEDIEFNNKIKAEYKLLIKMFVEFDALWITSDNRIKTTPKGTKVLQELLANFVDFNPKPIKFLNTRYE